MKKLLIILILVSSCTKVEKYKCSNDVVIHIKDNTIEYSTVVYGGDISKTIIKITEKSKSKLVARYNPLEGLAGGEGIFFQLVFDKKNAVLERTSMMPGYDKPKVYNKKCVKY